MTSALPSMGIQTPSIDIISPPKTTTQLTTPQLSKKQQLYHFQNPAKDMSFLRTIAIRAPRAPLAATASTKRVHFSTSPYVQKDSASAVKDTIDSVKKNVGDAAAKGIEKGREFIPPHIHTSRITVFHHRTCTLQLQFSSISCFFP